MSSDRTEEKKYDLEEEKKKAIVAAPRLEEKLVFSRLPSVAEFFSDVDGPLTAPVDDSPEDTAKELQGLPQVTYALAQQGRNYQEDRWSITRVPQQILASLTSTQRDAAFASPLTYIDSQITEHSLGGSTACVLFAVPNPNNRTVVTTTYDVADSQAFAIDVEEKKATITPLTSNLDHLGSNSSTPEFKVHINAADLNRYEYLNERNEVTGYFRATYDAKGNESRVVVFEFADLKTPDKGDYRLKSGLNMGNSIGDPRCRVDGKVCKVHIDHNELKVNQNNTLILAVVSDGVTERFENPLDQKELSPLATITQHALLSGENISQQIISKAPLVVNADNKEGPGDNRTCLSAIFRLAELQNAEPTIMAVFDGHRVFKTAEILRKAYLFLVKAEMYRMALENQLQHHYISDQVYATKIDALAQYLIAKTNELSKELSETNAHSKELSAQIDDDAVDDTEELSAQIEANRDEVEVIQIIRQSLLANIDSLKHNNPDLLLQTFHLLIDPNLKNEQARRNFSQQTLNQLFTIALDRIPDEATRNQQIRQGFAAIWHEIKPATQAETETSLAALLHSLKNNQRPEDISRASDSYTDLVIHIVQDPLANNLPPNFGNSRILDAIENEVAILQRNNANQAPFFQTAVENTFRRLLQLYQYDPNFAAANPQRQRIKTALGNCIKIIQENADKFPNLNKELIAAQKKSRLACFLYGLATAALILLSLLLIAAFVLGNAITGGVLSFLAPLAIKIYCLVGCAIGACWTGYKTSANWATDRQAALREVTPPKENANQIAPLTIDNANMPRSAPILVAGGPYRGGAVYSVSCIRGNHAR